MYLKSTCRNSRQQLRFINTPSDLKWTPKSTLSIWSHLGRCCISVLEFRANFAELPFEEEILEFLRFLGHSAQNKTLTNVNVNKLYQLWRSFAAVINKCLTGKSTGFDSLRDDILFSTIKVVSRHQNTQQYGAILPIELTTEDIRNTKAYKEYYACATGKAAPKPKASARKKKGGSASSTTPLTPIATPTPTTTVVAAPRLTAATKEETTEKEKESFDPIPRTPEDSKDDGNGEEDQGLRITLLPSPTSTMTPSIMTTTITASQPPIPSTPIPSEVLQNLPTFESEMTEAVREAVQTQTNQLQDSLQRENDEFLRTIDDNMKKIIKEQVKSQVKAQVRRILPRIKESMNAQLEAEVLTKSSHSSRTSYAVAADLSKMELKKILIDKMEGNKEDVRMMMIRKDPPLDQTGGLRDEEKAGSMHQPALHLNQLPGVQAELEYHLEEVYKAMTDQLDWVNPEGQQYPHNLLQPFPLIPDNRGHRVIPFEHLINNDLEYIQGDLVPRTMWIQEPLNYDKHALWGVSHWGRKRQQFYGFAVNQESALDVYSKRRIITVIDLKIVKWHNYKHLDWISVRRDDDKIYKFKEGDFKRLRLQDIEDILLLLVQGKLSNLTVEERFAFNVSLRMFMRSIVIQRRVEDLQLGVEGYQKRLNLTKPDTYRSDLKRREVYTAYSYPRGFIYQNKDKKNRLIQIDELHKFSDGTLNDVRNVIDDRLKGIRMQYLPTTIWKKGDKDRAAAMIQAIDNMLKTRRIMRSLE
nr:hypothetical protein [Tanacetum cinerariifolium]